MNTRFNRFKPDDYRAIVRRSLVIASFTALRFCPAAASDVAAAVSHDSSNAGPVITIEAPRQNDETLSGPVPIALAWSAQDDAAIDLDSFRVKYKWGFGTKDITKTVLAAMRGSSGSRLDANGLYVPSAHLPPGRHHLVIELADTRQRRSQTELEFQIAKR